MIQIVVYLQSLLRQVLLVMFTHDIFGSVDPNIPRFYNVHVLIQMRTYLYACLKAGIITLFPTAESTK
jgi:hypothetical protein